VNLGHGVRLLASAGISGILHHAPDTPISLADIARVADMKDHLAALREEYTHAGLSEADLAPDPFAMFGRWFADAAELAEPNAMVLATVSPAGQPSSRMVLLKGVDARGFAFFTNLGSRKATDLAANPRCSLLFPWHGLQRQVRVEGVAELLDRDEVAAYFSTRPRGAQLGAWASPQSSVVTSDELSARFAGADANYPGDVPAPDFWGGYVVRPRSVEFWQGRQNRMHDRLRYRREGDTWLTERLAP
jgi:pyridoxamine 5'-phosphate oxidase